MDTNVQTCTETNSNQPVKTGTKIIEGKTKIILEILDHSVDGGDTPKNANTRVLVLSKDRITAGIRYHSTTFLILVLILFNISLSLAFIPLILMIFQILS